MNYPSVTVVMPVRNEADFIEHSLGAVLAQDYPADRMEVIIADGMSDDGTREIIRRMAEDGRPETGDGRRETEEGEGSAIYGPRSAVIVLDNPHRIVPTGMNAAIQQAEGDVIVRVDGHALIEPDYVRQCVQWLARTGADCVGGAVESRGIGYVGEAIAVAMSSPFGIGNSGFRTATLDMEPRPTDTVPFGAFRREVFERVGLFNEQMVRHQDYEFNYRLRKAGGQILLLPSARAAYYVRSTLSSLWKQYWQYGLWKGRFLRAHPDSLKLRHMIPPLFVLVLVLSSLLAFVSPVGRWTLGLTLSAYAAFVVLAIGALMKNGQVRYAPLFPVIFACLHVSYGLGIWLGLFSTKRSKIKTHEAVLG